MTRTHLSLIFSGLLSCVFLMCGCLEQINSSSHSSNHHLLEYGEGYGSWDLPVGDYGYSYAPVISYCGAMIINDTFVVIATDGSVSKSSDGVSWAVDTIKTNAIQKWGVFDVLYFDGAAYLFQHSKGIYRAEGADFSELEKVGSAPGGPRAIWSKDRILVYGSGDTLRYSYNGVDWDYVALNKEVSVAGLASSGKRLVAVAKQSGDPSTILFVANDISTWQEHELPDDLTIYDIIWDGRQFVAVGAIATDSLPGKVFTSADGIDWHVKSSFVSFIPRKITSSRQSYVILGRNGHPRTSSDLLSWDVHLRIDAMYSDYDKTVWTGKNYFLFRKDAAYVSTDGYQWEKRL